MLLTPFLALTLAPVQDLGGQVAAQDETARGYAVVELVGPERAPFAGEVFVLRLRGGVDVDVLEQNLVQPFRQRLDVPVQLEHPWFAADLEQPAPASPVRFAGDAEVLAEVAVGAMRTEASRYVERGAGDRRFKMVEVERAFQADLPGRLEAPQPRLVFAYSTDFREDLVAGRVPLDRHDAFVQGEALAIEVRALPEADQPFSFTGAVGRFDVTATRSPVRVAVGESVDVTWTCVGDPAALGTVEPPKADRLAGMRLSHTSTTRTAGRLEVVFGLVVEDAALDAVPSIEFSSFDPGAEVYVAYDTAPLPLVVDPTPATTGGAAAPPGHGRVGVSWIVVVGGVIALFLFLAIAATRRG